MISDVSTIYVVYNPDFVMLRKSILSIRDQVASMLVVDNTVMTTVHDALMRNLLQEFPSIEYIRLNENKGIAAAQNIGMRRSMDHDYIMLSDQDTLYPENYAADMTGWFERINDAKVAAIAPDFSEINRGGERQGFVVFRGVFSRKIKPKSGCVSISHAIASGLVISTKVIGKIGMMDEDLFIDWVDLEWCWRAIGKGYKILGCSDVVISHTLGDRAVKVGRIKYPVRSHIRHYFIIRNAVYIGLYGRGIRPLIRLNVLLKMLKYLVGFTTLGKPHGINFVYCAKGIYDGTLKRLGPLRIR